MAFDLLPGAHRPAVDRDKLMKFLDDRPELADLDKKNKGIDIFDNPDYSDDDDYDLDGLPVKREESATPNASQSAADATTATGAEAVIPPSASADVETAAIKEENARLYEAMRALGETGLAAERARREQAEQKAANWEAWYANEQAAIQAQQPQQPVYVDPVARQQSHQALQILEQDRKRNQKQILDNTIDSTLAKLRNDPDYGEDFDTHVPAEMLANARQNLKVAIDQGKEVPLNTLEGLIRQQYDLSFARAAKASKKAQAVTNAQADRQQAELDKLDGMPKGAASFQTPKTPKVDPRKAENKIGSPGFRDRVLSFIDGLPGL